MAIKMTRGHILNVVRGYKADFANLEYIAEFASSVNEATRSQLIAGTICSLDNTGKMVIGVGNNRVMPLILKDRGDGWSNVMPNAGNPATDAGVAIGINPENWTTLVASGGYEIIFENYDSTLNYPPNTFLTSPLTGANAGKVIPGTIYTNMIIGQVSAGIVSNKKGPDVGVQAWVFPIYPTA